MADTLWVGTSTSDQIKIKSLQRIADACELMAKSHAQLVSDRDMYERWYREGKETSEWMANRIRALKGVITRMKRRAR